MSPGTALRGLSRPQLVPFQGTVLAIILVLALAMVGSNAYLLHNIAILKQMYYAEFSQDCSGCSIPPWFTGDRQHWGELAKI